MIIHSGGQSYSLEGTFANGLANGVVRKSAPGSPDTVRLYENGRDVGAAPRGSEVATPFVSSTEPDTGAPVAGLSMDSRKG